MNKLTFVDDFMKRFTLYHADTLFPPNWDALKDNRCILCGNRLKFPKAKVMAYCASKKHKRFVITLSRLERIQELYK